MSVTVKRRRKRFRTGRAAPVQATESTERPEQPALVADATYSADDLTWGIWGYAQWLVNDWTLQADQRLDAMNADLYDLGDRVNQLIIMLCVGLIGIGVGVGALLFLALT